MGDNQPYVTLRSRRPADGISLSSGDSTYGSSAGDDKTAAATHDISRVNYHVKHLSDFAKSLEDSAARAFPNHGRSQRYKKVQTLLLHWNCDDLFVLPELEDLEQCLRDDYSFETEKFPIPSDNPHLELMMRVGAMIKEHESSDTLFIIYYGGHARIDESRQSTWCATRSSESPWLQWSAIQTLLERSLSDVLILLDCCAGAASATFPNGNSITETISASSWDAIAPDPGRYSFTNAVIEVLQEWKNRTYSAAMLHAEILARLKHPRPIVRLGKHFETRSTPVHFMMTSNHRAPSIEMARIVSSDKRPPSPPQELESEPLVATGRSVGPHNGVGTEPNDDVPHVMISLALEDDQRLDLNAWENWLSAFPAIAKYVKVQGVFKSHSTLLLLSLPVMVWDLLPDDLACNFIAFIRSNNMAMQDGGEPEAAQIDVPAISEEESRAIHTHRTTLTYDPRALPGGSGKRGRATSDYTGSHLPRAEMASTRKYKPSPNSSTSTSQTETTPRWGGSPILGQPQRHPTAPASNITRTASSDGISRQMILNQARSFRRTLVSSDNLPTRPKLAPHVQSRLEDYFQEAPDPTVAVKEFLASNLGIETTDIDLWFYHRREQQEVANRLQSLTIDDHRQEPAREGPRMILPGHLNTLLEIFPIGRVLLVDLRSQENYERSHIHGSINFRAPATFVQRASLAMLEKALADEASRKAFNQWYTSECVVFYDRHVEFAWECPTAEALYHKFKGKGWNRHGFILKGHYREFSESFDRYIGGQRMSENAKKCFESLTERSLEKKTENQEQYKEWLRLLVNEDRIPTELVPVAKAERMEAMVRHQKELEDEFERRMPSLYRKVLDLKPDNSNWDRKVTLVEPLSRGLTKMHEAGRAGGDSKSGYPGYHDKPRGNHQLPTEDYDLMDSDDEQPSNEAAFQKSSIKLSEDAAGASSGSGDLPKKGRGPRGLLQKVLRSGR
ncbi:uncharacterized protein BCR38DRAFT_420262 [Pseudomassariella vexata]|uniref:Homeobox domain-containing protein n=1 Tax=Pseudomassariella vexata TaxID=1141098 RepID=A0A1Y2EEW4_9PEZI|nr:uncharacterized protein BCR38DRAFT_420262 [Pseudomassariella vexata]ORY69854.1 hypothetical protein BCR38DRAFT_420262 [Pseudomassariella vexata]